MTNTQTGTLVFKDQAGEYYLLPQETLEKCRVPAEHKAEIERLIAEQQDAHGYAIPGGPMTPIWNPPYGDPYGAFFYFFETIGYKNPWS